MTAEVVSGSVPGLMAPGIVLLGGGAVCSGRSALPDPGAFTTILSAEQELNATASMITAVAREVHLDRRSLGGVPTLVGVGIWVVVKLTGLV
jgi:hypothetical protein